MSRISYICIMVPSVFHRLSLCLELSFLQQQRKGLGGEVGQRYFLPFFGGCRGASWKAFLTLGLHTGMLCPDIWSSSFKTPNLQAVKGENTVQRTKPVLMVVSWFFLEVWIGTHVTPLNFCVVCDAQVNLGATMVNVRLCWLVSQFLPRSFDCLFLAGDTDLDSSGSSCSFSQNL